jgi:hypothetical protein
MHHTKQNPHELAGYTGARKTHTNAANYQDDACHCQCRGICETCQHLRNIRRLGTGYRAWTQGAKTTLTAAAIGMALVSGTMAATRASGLVCRNAFIEAVASPTESGLLSRPNLTVYGRGALIRKVGGVTTGTFETPRPPYARSNANGGLSVFPVGANHE